MKIEILASGSMGNAILFGESLLLDTGISYRKLKKQNINVSAVLLTHIHGDHFNSSTIRNIHVHDEKVKFCCGEFLKGDLLNMGIPENNIAIIHPGEKYQTNGFIFSPISLYHDVSNFGYRIMNKNHKHFHATDTVHLKGVMAKNYDSATLECNHHKERAVEIISEKFKNGMFSHLKRTIETHLSVQNAIEFVKKNNIKKLIPVHIGSSTRKEVEDYILKKVGKNSYH